MNFLDQFVAQIWAEYDQRFWHTIAHGDQCCCVLPPSNTRT